MQLSCSWRGRLALTALKELVVVLSMLCLTRTSLLILSLTQPPTHLSHTESPTHPSSLPPLLPRGLHTALWRLLHPLTYNNKEQRAVFAANRDYIRTAAAALSLPNSGACSGAGAGTLFVVLLRAAAACATPNQL